MRFALNLGTLRGPGAAAVGRGLLPALTQRGSRHDFIAWIPHGWSSAPEIISVSAELYSVGEGLWSKLWLDQARVRRELVRGEWDVLFSLSDITTVGCSRPHLLLLHQANLVAPPEDLDFEIPLKFRLRLSIMRRIFRQCLNTVDVVTVQTEYMKRGLIERWHLTEDRIAVVPSSVDDNAVRQYEWQPCAADPPFVFYPAMAYPHRNHLILADMMRGLVSRGLPLRCAVTVDQADVPEMANRAAQLGVLERFDFLGRCSQQQVHGMMAASSAVVFPSKLESFGIPYLEAMAIGVPLVVADRPVAREVCGDGAMYCDSSSGDSFADAIEVICQHERAGLGLSLAGRHRFKRLNYSWAASAERYLTILESLATRR